MVTVQYVLLYLVIDLSFLALGPKHVLLKVACRVDEDVTDRSCRQHIKEHLKISRQLRIFSLDDISGSTAAT